MKPARVALIFTLLAFVCIPPTASAQLGLGSSEALSLTLTPQYPKPGSVVTVTPFSTLIGLTNSTMTVSVGGKRVYSGTAKSTPVTLNGVGVSTAITVTVTSEGRSYSKSVTLKPGDVSLVTEPIASAPALYEGKPLIAESGSVRLVAVADLRTSPSARIDPATLSYTWTLDGTTLQNASGLGRTSIVVPSPLAYRTQEVSVLVQSPGGSLVGGDATTLTPQNATLRLYIHDPLQGTLFDRAVTGNSSVTGSELTLIAVPYSLSLALGAPTIQWFLNGASAQSGPLITLRPQGSGQGSASLTATAGGGTNASATASLSLTFGGSTNIFGL